MERLTKYFDKVSEKLSVMVGDMQKTVDAVKTKKERQMKTVMPLTKIYKDEKEAKKAKEHPEEDYITKGVDNAFKG